MGYEMMSSVIRKLRRGHVTVRYRKDENGLMPSVIGKDHHSPISEKILSLSRMFLYQERRRGTYFDGNVRARQLERAQVVARSW